MRLCPWSLALSILVLGLERVCPRKGCPWPRIFFVSLALASSLVSSTLPLPFKSVSLIIPLKHNEPIHEMQLFYNESVVANKDVSKYLGAFKDSKLNFKAFINHVESKIAKSVGIVTVVDCVIYSRHPLYYNYISVYFNPIFSTDFSFGKHFSLLPHKFAAPPKKSFKNYI